METQNILTPKSGRLIHSRCENFKTNDVIMSILRMLLLLFSSIGAVAANMLTSSVDGRHTICPGERVTYTCTVTQALVLEWTAEPFINSTNRRQFSSTTPPGDRDRFLSCSNRTSSIKCTDLDYYANLTRVRAFQNGFADMTSTFGFTASAKVNGTVVQCRGLTATEDQMANRTLNVTGLPSPPLTPSFMVQMYDRNRTILTVQWQPPQYDGGAPINYTMIVCPDFSSLTTNVTSVQVILPYNVMHTVSIVATNCNGSSSATMETIRIANCGNPTAPESGYVEVYQNTAEGAEIHFKCNPGFLPSGRMRAVCAKNGKWNPDPSHIKCTVPPSVNLSCVDLSGDVSGIVNVTVSWRLSGGDSADFYLINITTNAPQTPYGGLLNITNASATQFELTGFMADYEYSITVCGFNCGSNQAGESEPLTITPQLPAVPSSCNITVSYNSHSSGRLQSINSSWDSVPDSVDPGEACPCPNGDIIQYQIYFQSGPVVVTDNVSITRCISGRCSHTFKPPSNPPSSYDSVSVAAENVIGVGATKTCTQQLIMCILPHLLVWHVTLIIIGVLALMGAVVMTIWMMITYWKSGGKVKLWKIALVVITAIFCALGGVLWSAVGVVVLNPPNGNVCDPHWCHFRNRMIVSGFVFSVLPIILVPTVLFIYTMVKEHVHIYCKKGDVKANPRNPIGLDGSGTMQLQEDEVTEPGYDSIQQDPHPSRAVPDPSELSYSYPTEVSTGLRYAELGPHIPSSAVAPPPIDNNVWYTSLLDDHDLSKQISLTSAGSLPTNVDKTSYPLSPLDTEDFPPPIPPQKFSDEDILLLSKLSESIELQQDGRDTPHPLPPKTNQKEANVPPLPSMINEDNMALPPLPPKTNLEETTVPPLPPKTNKDDIPPPHPSKTSKKAATLPTTPPMVNQEDASLTLHSPKAKQDDTTLPSHSSKKNEEGTALPKHPTEQTTEEEKGPVAVPP